MQNILVETKDIRLIPFLLDMIKDTKVTKVNLAEMELYLRLNLQKDDYKLCIAFDGENINGFIMAYVVTPMIIPELFVAWTYVAPGFVEVHQQFNERIEHWAKTMGIKKISASVHKNLKVYEKEFGFKLESYIISKEIELDKENSK